LVKKCQSYGHEFGVFLFWDTVYTYYISGGVGVRKVSNSKRDLQSYQR